MRGHCLRGHLRMTCALDARGVSHLREQSFAAPLHLSKTHLDAGCLVANAVNPTAGLFDGDSLEISAAGEPGARLLLTTPSATRVHRARTVGFATVDQRLSVAEGAFLEVFPEPFIPQAGARYLQRTELRVEEGGGLLFFEWMAPGRVARGEAHAFSRLEWDTDLSVGGQLCARERYTLDPLDDSLEALRLLGPATHYLGCFVTGVDPWPAEALERLGSDAVYLGHGPLPHGAGTVKALCRDSLSARATMAALRATFHHALGRRMPRLGRF